MSQINLKSLSEFTHKVFKELDDADMVVRQTAEQYLQRPKDRNLVRTYLRIECPECHELHDLTEEYWGEFNDKPVQVINCGCGCSFTIKFKKENLS